MTKSMTQYALTASLALLLSACGSGMSSFSSQGSSGLDSSLGSGLSLEKIEQEALQAETALVEAQAAIDNVVKNGRIQVPGEDVGVSAEVSEISTQSLTGIAERLEKALDQLYLKMTAPIQKAKDALAQARAQLAATLGQLDPNNPAHASMIQRIEDMMARLDQIEGRLGGIYQVLASKIDLLLQKVDQLIARVPSNPLGFILIYELQEVRRVIEEFRDKLAST